MASKKDNFSLYFYHGGKLFDVQSSITHYGGGGLTSKHGFDVDRFGYFDLVDEVDKLGYKSFERLAYQIPGSNVGMKFISNDRGVMEMLEYVSQGHSKFFIYVDGGIKDRVAKSANSVDITNLENSCEQGSGKEDIGEEGCCEEDSSKCHSEHGENPNMQANVLDEVDEDSDNDPDYEPVEEAESDDGLDDADLASDDEEYVEARINFSKYKNYVPVDEVAAVPEPSVIVSEYEDSDREMNSDGTSEEGELDCEGNMWKKQKKVRYDPSCDQKTFEFVLNMRFDSAKQCRSAVRKYGLSQGLPIYFTRSSNSQVEAHCGGECEWRLYGSMIQRERTFAIKSLRGKHTCHRVMENKLATYDWIASEYLHKWRKSPNWPISSLEEALMDTYGLEVPKMKCYRARWKALEMLRGSVEDHYALLRKYQAELRRVDEKGRFEFLLDDAGCLKGFFVGFSGLIQGYLKGCRPILGFDGCFLKTFLGGALLTVIGKDENNEMFPICWAVVQSENEYFWTWFMKIVFQELNIVDGLGWTFISDQQKGLLNAIQKLTPYAEVRNCARHMYINWKKEFKGQSLKTLYWGAAMSTYEAKYLEYLEDMKLVDEAAYKNFIERDPTKFCKLYATSIPKCDMVDNNICETFNGCIVKSRSKHIIEMLEEIRCYVMERQHNKLIEMSQVTNSICSKIRTKLEMNKYKSRNCQVKPAIGAKFQVSCGEDQFVVDLKNWACTCRAWDLSGIPCVHACSSIQFMKKDTVDYIDSYYSVTKYIAAYSLPLEPINGKNMWPRVEG